MEGDKMTVMKKEEQIGFHKGAINTLLKERQEMVRIITVIDQLLKAHASGLQQLGIKIGKTEEKKLEKALD
ncbi:MAG: hypothetical protein PHC66_00645 [Candidatus Nanoarchaeia archaeon]|nr:hypothetical protein [Candidatus Nanoarchaeia archaeon]